MFVKLDCCDSSWLGCLLNVENFSKFALSDPRLELECGDAPYEKWEFTPTWNDTIYVSIVFLLFLGYFSTVYDKVCS